MLRGNTYVDGDTVLITDIGEGDDAALLCVTDCAGDPHFAGEFYYPNGSVVNVKGSGDSLYRNRGDGLVRLNRRNNVLSPLGRYSCDISDSRGVIQSIYINIGGSNVIVACYIHVFVFLLASAMDPPTCPPLTPCPQCPTTPGKATCSTPPTCETCPTPTQCPTVTCPIEEPCPTCPPQIDCETCPLAPTCPPTTGKSDY